jgi:beta-phosphoglucomutase family hydrolase
MPPTGSSPVDWDRFEAVLFDLDGVLTDTASLHSEAWKQTFDEFLRQRAEASGEPFREFDIGEDYRRYVDGRPRYDGVRDFLHSRGIELPEGPEGAAPGFDSVRALGNRKDELVNRLFGERGVVPFAGSLALLRRVRERGLRTAVVTSSANCTAVLAAAKIQDLFDAKVDGVVAAGRALAGKPAPDSFLEGARELGVPPARAVVVEDAISGVQAGRSGGFGLVIGVARKGNARDLADNGADVVVEDLAELLDS